MVKNVPYDASKDFDYITIPVQAPNVLVASPTQKARSVSEVIAALKANPGKISFASSGNGSSDHLSAELFWQQTGTEAVHVPYKGGAPAITDLLGGQVDFSFQNVNAVLPHLRSGKLRAIAVTGSQRSPVLPDVPTLAESGVKGAEVYPGKAWPLPRACRRCQGQTGQGAPLSPFSSPTSASALWSRGWKSWATRPRNSRAFRPRRTSAGSD
jgi:tripartite-type tricarboxylate transporter receptor subunit TctC